MSSTTDRRGAIRRWIEAQMEAIIEKGMYSGPQQVSVRAFLPDGEDMTIWQFRERIHPRPSAGETLEILNGLIKEKKLFFAGFYVVESGTVVGFLQIP